MDRGSVVWRWSVAALRSSVDSAEGSCYRERRLTPSPPGVRFPPGPPDVCPFDLRSTLRIKGRGMTASMGGCLLTLSAALAEE